MLPARLMPPLLPLVLLGTVVATAATYGSERVHTAEATLILCKPSATVARWLALPTESGPAVTLRLASHPTLCILSSGGSLVLGACTDAPAFRLLQSKRYPARGFNLLEVNRTTGRATGRCVDARGLAQAQLYKCLDSANQGWNINASAGSIRETFDRHGSILGLSSDCAAAKPAPPAPARPARAVFCPRFHPIGGPKVFDPSGPLLDDSGRWHLWEDEGGWSNWTSPDLMHWHGRLASSTHFSGLTGSVSPTPAGIFAFWPGRNSDGASAVESAVCNDCTAGGGWSDWTHRGFPPGLVVPSREAAGSFRDPARAFSYNGSWYVGVGCGQSVHDRENGGGAVCLFKATNDSLSEFTDVGNLYRTNHSHGSFGRTVQVYNRSHDISFNMIECPGKPASPVFVLPTVCIFNPLPWHCCVAGSRHLSARWSRQLGANRKHRTRRRAKPVVDGHNEWIPSPLHAFACWYSRLRQRVCCQDWKQHRPDWRQSPPRRVRFHRLE